MARIKILSIIFDYEATNLSVIFKSRYNKSMQFTLPALAGFPGPPPLIHNSRAPQSVFNVDKNFLDIHPFKLDFKPRAG